MRPSTEEAACIPTISISIWLGSLDAHGYLCQCSTSALFPLPVVTRVNIASGSTDLAEPRSPGCSASGVKGRDPCTPTKGALPAPTKRAEQSD
ncbi:hypothetical protein E2C01_058638 [Portunus trituberculatus]|uniref:Uncharacterized protein n=1 Tax=Portunus trituberculatus TaxID=210409 RepID=A0A5B7GX19_PORTR|nr:hypothetical protein [Portunus trituberculatus]